MATFDDYIHKLSNDTVGITVDLPKDLVWQDELNWSKIVQSVEWSLTGALLIQEGVKLKGRNITLVGKDDMAWITRQQAEQLVQLRDTPELVMTLNFEHKTTGNKLFEYPVRFRHAENGLELVNIKDFDGYEPDAWYIIKAIRLMEV